MTQSPGRRERLAGGLRQPPATRAGTEAAPETSDRGPPLGEASREPGCLEPGPPPLPGDPAGAGNQAHMARPALFVLAARRRCLRRFLSPRNQQNPKRSLGKMKGAEGPGRGGPRGCGGLELAPGRRRPGGERARPWGVSERAGREAGVHSRSPASSRPRPRPGPPRRRNADFFKASLKPRRRAGDFAPGGGRPSGEGARTPRPPGSPPRTRCPRPPSSSRPLWRRHAGPEPARGTVGRGALAVGPGPGGAARGPP